MQSNSTLPTLFYVADPMCSWCWGFSPAIEMICERFTDAVQLRYVMGGLARDSDQAMPAEMRRYVRGAWEEVASRTGARFNWNFWQVCQPRRSTYPACRAVLAAAAQREEAGPQMFQRIQRAYYLEARNPADASTLLELAEELHLEVEHFKKDLASEEIEQDLHDDFIQRRRLQANAFPSLVLAHGERSRWIARGWLSTREVATALSAALEVE
ncbi:MAG: DsbA family protein [Candidatus Latescibacterota bacterium]